MPWELPIGAIVQGGLAAYNQRGRIETITRKIAYFVQHGRLRVVVFGPPGVGKSTLGGFLASPTPGSTVATPYRPSRIIERHAIAGDFAGGLVITPGQQDLYDQDWEELFSYLRDGTSRIVINVVSWGHHSIATLPYQETNLYQLGISKEEFVSRHVEESRAAELAMIEQLEAHLLTAKRRIRMITVITKQDLWWDHRALVRQHYEHGRYGEIIERVSRERILRNRGFYHEYCPVSLIGQNFTDGRGEILVPTTQGYDQGVQQGFQNSLVETVRAYARRK
jgi:hypothetical protein